MLIPAVPAAMFAAVRFVNDEPSPANVAADTLPLAVRLVAPIVVAVIPAKAFVPVQVLFELSRFELLEVMSDKNASCCVVFVLSWNNRCVFVVVSHTSPVTSVAGFAATPTTFKPALFGPAVKVCLVSATNVFDVLL